MQTKCLNCGRVLTSEGVRLESAIADSKLPHMPMEDDVTWLRCGKCYAVAKSPMNKLAVVYHGRRRETPVTVLLRLVTPEIGETACIECNGTGWWGFGPTPAECDPCVECKGTGRMFVGC